MPWRSAIEIEKYLLGLPSLDLLERAFALHLFAEQAVFPGDYESSSAWTDLVVPSEEGLTLFARAGEILSEFPRQDVHFALFGLFYHHDILIDYQASDLEAIKALLNEELVSLKLRWPYRSGRLLYDRYNDSPISDRTDHITPSEIARLLDGTPQGVYQVGNIVSGPLGFRQSQERRFLPPMLSLPLWHCSDTGCSTKHSVRVIPPKIPVVNAYARLVQSAMDHYGPRSEWSKPLAWLSREFGEHKRREYNDLYALIGNCILKEERSALVESALRTEAAGMLRETIGCPPHARDTASGAPGEVARRLSPEEQLQILLLLPDRTLVGLIDDCVFRGQVQNPTQGGSPLK